METINKMKRQPTEGEKIFANDKTEINLVQYRFSIKKKTKKWMEDLNRHFSKEDKQMTKST